MAEAALPTSGSRPPDTDPRAGQLYFAKKACLRVFRTLCDVQARPRVTQSAKTQIRFCDATDVTGAVAQTHGDAAADVFKDAYAIEFLNLPG